jgi:hypothetical protein
MASRPLAPHGQPEPSLTGRASRRRRAARLACAADVARVVPSAAVDQPDQVVALVSAGLIRAYGVGDRTERRLDTAMERLQLGVRTTSSWCPRWRMPAAGLCAWVRHACLHWLGREQTSLVARLESGDFFDDTWPSHNRVLGVEVRIHQLHGADLRLARRRHVGQYCGDRPLILVQGDSGVFRPPFVPPPHRSVA